MSFYSSSPDWNLILGEKKVNKAPSLDKDEKELLKPYTTIWELEIDQKMVKSDPDSFKRLKNMIVASMGVVYLEKDGHFYLFFLDKVIGSSTPEAYFSTLWPSDNSPPEVSIFDVFTDPEQDGASWAFTLDESFMKTSYIDAQTVSDFLKILGYEFTYERPVVKIVMKAKTPDDAMNKLKARYASIKDDLKPRKLTPPEIDFILAFLGADDVSAPMPCAITEIGVKLKSEYRKFLVSELQQHEYSPMIINATARNLKLSFERALIPAGATVGLTAAEALGGPVTQMALNSFHAPTSAKSTSTGVDAIKEIFNMTRNRKFKTSTIYFSDPNLSFDEVIKMRIPLVEVNVNTVIYPEKTVIDHLSNLGGEEWWHKAYLESVEQARFIDDERWIMRLYVNPEILYAYDLTIYEVASAINKYNITKDAIKAIPSPMLWTDSQGQGPVIDIIPNGEVFDTYIMSYMKERGVNDKHLSLNDYNLDLNFLNSVLLNVLKNNIIQGIKGIEQLFPVSANVPDVIKGEKASKTLIPLHEYMKLSIKEAKKIKNEWSLSLDVYQMIEKGISHRKVSLLCEACGLVIDETHTEEIKVTMPSVRDILEDYCVQWALGKKKLDERDALNKILNDGSDKEKDALKTKLIDEAIMDPTFKDLRKPKTYIDYRIKEDEKNKNETEERVRLEAKDNESRLYMKPKSKIEIASKLMYAETNGSNTFEVAKLPFIDMRRTHSNDFYEIYKLFGIEAIRQYLIRDLDSVIKEGRGYVLMRHIALLMDYMTNLGSPLAISYTGMSMQGKGTLASASYERPMEILLRAAGKGRTENINSVSAAIFTGKTAKIGTGFMDVADDAATANELDKYLDNSENVFVPISDSMNLSEKELYEWDFEKEEEGGAGEEK